MSKVVIALYGNEDDKTIPWFRGEKLLYLGEIENLPGKCTIARDDGQIYWGHSSSSFIEFNEEQYKSFMATRSVHMKHGHKINFEVVDKDFIKQIRKQIPNSSSK